MYRKSGFTLAEVIITLTIVGVISTIIIPDFITSVNETHYKIAAKKAYVDLSGVIRQMMLDKVH